jgi:ATP-dependent DNA helicase RecQ
MENDGHKDAAPEGADPLDRAALSRFGIPYLLPYQKLVIAGILEAAEELNAAATGGGAEALREDREGLGRRVVIFPTGAGKSLCFQIPALFLDGITLVIYPLLALMADQARRLSEQGIPCALLRGGQSAEERQAQWEKLRAGGVRILIANPEILLTQAARKQLATLRVAHLVFDEAHCVSEWGETFRPSYLAVREIIEAAGTAQVSAFTATASEAVLEKIRARIFGEEGARTVIANPDRPSIAYAALGCVLPDRAVREVLAGSGRPALVFCASRTGTETLARYLRSGTGDREIRFYHAGLEKREKTALEDWFFQSRRGVLTATCAYGMGMDKPDIRTVIHRDCPPSVEAYLQESGRAGRDGNAARAVLLFGPDDRRRLGRDGAGDARERRLKLMEYARNTGECRRDALLRLLDYRGGHGAPHYACCDVCAGTARAGHREAAALIPFFRRNRRRYTIAEASRVLSSGGAAPLFSRNEAFEAVLGLLETGELKRLGGLFWKDKIMVSGKEFSG